MPPVARADLSDRRSLLWLAAFLAVVIVPGAVIGFATAPGAWYAGLQKPPFNPPAWIFAPVWLFLYVLIAFAGWRIWMKAPRSTTMLSWGAQQVLNWLWSPVFFTAHLPWLSLVIIIAMIVLIAFFVWSARRIDRPAAWAFVPYLAWVSFATLLNASLAVLN